MSPSPISTARRLRSTSKASKGVPSSKTKEKSLKASGSTRKLAGKKRERKASSGEDSEDSEDSELESVKKKMRRLQAEIDKATKRKEAARKASKLFKLIALQSHAHYIQ
ncbi:hypothetical protein FOMPIDRAFT_1056877, partial [Fomitopsis schrenkii]